MHLNRRTPISSNSDTPWFPKQLRRCTLPLPFQELIVMCEYTRASQTPKRYILAGIPVVLLLIFGRPSIAAAQCKAACEVPQMDACPSCTIECPAGQVAMCTPGESVPASGSQKKCTKQPTCRCEGKPSRDQADCGMGCGNPVLLGNPCPVCSIICPSTQLASCLPGKASDLWVEGKVAKCTSPPRCWCD